MVNYLNAPGASDDPKAIKDEVRLQRVRRHFASLDISVDREPSTQTHSLHDATWTNLVPCQEPGCDGTLDLVALGELLRSRKLDEMADSTRCRGRLHRKHKFDWRMDARTRAATLGQVELDSYEMLPLWSAQSRHGRYRLYEVDGCFLTRQELAEELEPANARHGRDERGNWLLDGEPFDGEVEPPCEMRVQH